MSRPSFSIDNSNLEAVRKHIRQQFNNLSWWPTQEPLQAKKEFEDMQASPAGLTDWCTKWLDGSEWRQLKRAVDEASSRFPEA